MSDDRLRHLQRKWKSSESVEDEALFLLEWRRLGGDLERRALELAAICQYPPAILALRRARLPQVTCPQDFLGFIQSLRDFGPGAWLRVRLIALRQHLSALRESSLGADLAGFNAYERRVELQEEFQAVASLVHEAALDQPLEATLAQLHPVGLTLRAARRAVVHCEEEELFALARADLASWALGRGGRIPPVVAFTAVGSELVFAPLVQDLSEERLRLLAYCGSLEASDRVSPPPTDSALWLEGLAEFGFAVAQRGVLAIANGLLLPVWEQSHWGADERPRKVVRALEEGALLGTPSSNLEAAALGAKVALDQASAEFGYAGVSSDALPVRALSEILALPGLLKASRLQECFRGAVTLRHQRAARWIASRELTAYLSGSDPLVSRA